MTVFRLHLCLPRQCYQRAHCSYLLCNGSKRPIRNRILREGIRLRNRPTQHSRKQKEYQGEVMRFTAAIKRLVGSRLTISSCVMGIPYLLAPAVDHAKTSILPSIKGSCVLLQIVILHFPLLVQVTNSQVSVPSVTKTKQ